MKKLLTVAALTATLVMGSCSSSGKAEKNEESLAEKIENCNDSDSIRIYVGQAQAYVQKLVDEGKLDEAREYLYRIEPVIEEKAPSFGSAFDKFKSSLSDMSDAVGDAADNLKDKAGEKADELKEKATDKYDLGKDAVDEAADKAKDRYDEVKDKTKDKAKEVSDKAKDKAKEAKDKARDKADEAKDRLKNAFN